MDLYSEQFQQLIDHVDSLANSILEIKNQMIDMNENLKEIAMCANGFANKYKAFPEK